MGVLPHCYRICFRKKYCADNISTNQLQSHDVRFFKPFKSAYNSFCDAWMASHPGQRITFIEIFSKANNKTASIRSAVKGFERRGIWPFDDQTFVDEGFAAARVTDEPKQIATKISDDPKPQLSHQLLTLWHRKRLRHQQCRSKHWKFETFLSDAQLERISHIPSTSACHPQCVVQELSGTPKSRIRRVHLRRLMHLVSLTEKKEETIFEEKGNKKVTFTSWKKVQEKNKNIRLTVTVDLERHGFSVVELVECWLMKTARQELLSACQICDSDKSD